MLPLTKKKRKKLRIRRHYKHNNHKFQVVALLYWHDRAILIYNTIIGDIQVRHYYSL